MDGVGRPRKGARRSSARTRTGVGCLYLKDLEQVDLEVLERIVRSSYRTLTKGTFTNRAREGGKADMRAVIAEWAGGPEVLTVVERPDPEPGPGEVVLDVAAAGLNRADLLQRRGFYPPPPGASDVLGMECSGTVAAVGAGRERLVGGRRGLRAAVRRRVRHQGRAAGRAADAGARRRRPGRRRRRCPRSRARSGRTCS